MTLLSFGEKVEADASLEMMYVDVEKRFVVVRDAARVVYSRIEVDAILAYTEEELFGFLRGRTSPRPLHHMARIVGYYSELKNWNRSKLAELADRHRGDYEVDSEG